MNTNRTQIAIYICLLLTNINITSQEESPNKVALTKNLFNIIETSNYITLQIALNHPNEFSKQFNCDYTAEELCNLQDKYNVTPLHIAAMHEGVKPIIAEKLILHGANLDAQTCTGFTPLHYPQNYKITKKLVEHGANLNIQDYIDPSTPLGQSQLWERDYAEEFLSSSPGMWRCSQLTARTKLLTSAPKYQEEWKDEIKTQRDIIREEVDTLRIEHKKRIATKKTLEQKDKDVIQRAMEKAQSKNPNFKEKDLYDRYVQEAFRTADTTAFTAVNRRADMLKQQLARTA